LPRLVDYVAETTGIRVSDETVRHIGETVVLFRRCPRLPEVVEVLQTVVDKHPTGTIDIA
jgi:hypothetical protein